MTTVPNHLCRVGLAVFSLTTVCTRKSPRFRHRVFKTVFNQYPPVLLAASPRNAVGALCVIKLKRRAVNLLARQSKKITTG